VFCKTGGRAKIAVSILRNHGFKDLVIVKEGGASEIAEACKVALVTNWYDSYCKKYKGINDKYLFFQLFIIIIV